MSKYKLNPVLFNKKINSAFALNMSLNKNYLLFFCLFYAMSGNIAPSVVI